MSESPYERIAKWFSDIKPEESRGLFIRYNSDGSVDVELEITSPDGPGLFGETYKENYRRSEGASLAEAVDKLLKDGEG